MSLSELISNPFLWISVAGFVISTFTRMLTMGQLKRVVGIQSRRAWTANRAANDMLKHYGYEDIPLVASQKAGNAFSSAYDQKSDSIIMGEASYRSTSIVAIVDALSSVAKAIQIKRGNIFITLRHLFLTPLRIVASFSIVAAIVALIFKWFWLYEAVFIIFSFITIISVISLPIEISNARLVKEAVATRGYLSEDEFPVMNTVLRSIVLSYLATIFQPITQFFRIIGSIFGVGRFRQAFSEASKETQQRQKEERQKKMDEDK